MTARGLTNLELRETLEESAAIRRRASEAEAEHYRLMNAAGSRVERAGKVIDAALDEIAAREHALDPIDGSDPEVRARIAAAWGEPEPIDPDLAVAMSAVAFLASLISPTPGIVALPALIQDDHGCWVTDDDDPTCREYPEARLGCAAVW
jgi:hypothetical protein